MIALATLAEAKTHLNILAADLSRDADVTMKLMQASDMVMARLKYDTVPDEWIANHSPVVYDIPFRIHGYTLLICAELFHNREGSVFNIDAILKLLDNDRMPTLA